MNAVLIAKIREMGGDVGDILSNFTGEFKERPPIHQRRTDRDVSRTEVATGTRRKSRFTTPALVVSDEESVEDIKEMPDPSFLSMAHPGEVKTRHGDSSWIDVERAVSS